MLCIMDIEYYDMIHTNPWVMKILKNLQTMDGSYGFEITDDAFVLEKTALYLKTNTGSLLRVLSEPKLGLIQRTLKFIYSLINVTDDGLSTIKDFCKGDRSKGCVFGGYLENWIFQQYLFYKLTS